MASINSKMDQLKLAIFAEVRSTCKDEATAALSDEQLNILLFHHRDGLRLTLQGFMQLKGIFTAYSFAIPETLKSRHRYGLSKMEYPYFFTRKRLVLFSEMDAMMVKLHGGIEGFLETYSNLDK